jgi:uncharacterized RDD family membrane protein YckC
VLAGIIDQIVTAVIAVLIIAIAARDLVASLRDNFLLYVNDVAQSGNPSTVQVPEPLLEDMQTIVFISGAVVLFYTIIFLGTWSATVGHRLCKLKVVRLPVAQILKNQGIDVPGLTDTARALPGVESLEPVGWLRAVSKGLGWAILAQGSLLMLIPAVINFVLPLFHRRRQSLTDIIAGTLVIHDPGPATTPEEPPAEQR